MVMVTALTAARMIAIEAASVVGGVVNGAGHLILTKHDLSTIDAGSVIGPQGIQGVPGDLDRASAQTITGIKTISKGLAFDGDGVLVNDIPLGKMGIGYDTVQFNIVDRIGGKALRFYDTVNGINRFDVNSGGQGVRALGDNSYFGGNAMDGPGGRLRLYAPAGDPTQAYLIAESSGATINLSLQTKGAGSTTVRNGAGAALVTINSAGDTTFIGDNHRMGSGAGGAAGTYLWMGSLGDPNNVYIQASGSPANVSIMARPKGTGGFNVQDQTTGVNKMSVSSAGNLWAIGPSNKFGSGAFGGTGAAIEVGDDGSNALIWARGPATNIALAIRSKGTSPIFLQNGDASTTWVQIQNAAADLDTWLIIRRSVGGVERLDRMVVGAPDSGGAGFRMLRLSN